MHRSMKKYLSQTGFTLVEIAIVLVIVGLLVAGLVTPLSVQRDVRDYSETRAELAEIREALTGFALSHQAFDGEPYLPCPDTSGDGSENRNIAGDCTSPTGAGDLPWQTLGIGQNDSWGNAYLYRVTAGYADSSDGFTLTTAGDNTIVNTAGGSNIATGIPAVIISKGKNGFGTSTDEGENITTGVGVDNTFVRKEQINVAANAFDDVVVWIPSTILVNRMVSAGLLP